MIISSNRGTCNLLSLRHLETIANGGTVNTNWKYLFKCFVSPCGKTKRSQFSFHKLIHMLILLRNLRGQEDIQIPAYAALLVLQMRMNFGQPLQFLINANIILVLYFMGLA